MEVTLRQASTAKVHQIWDAIGSDGNQVVDFASLMSTFSHTNIDDINKDLRTALEDRLVISVVVGIPQREEMERYQLPQISDLDRGDHDWYCFQCHVGGKIVTCHTCPRVYHLDCLPENRKPKKGLFICPCCDIMTTKQSSENVLMEVEMLNQLIKIIINRFKSWHIQMLEKADGITWAFAANRKASEAWRFGFLVYTPMDLEIMMTKANTGKYVSLEEVMVDCQTLVHAIGVYFGLELLNEGQIGQVFKF